MSQLHHVVIVAWRGGRVRVPVWIFWSATGSHLPELNGNAAHIRCGATTCERIVFLGNLINLFSIDWQTHWWRFQIWRVDTRGCLADDRRDAVMWICTWHMMRDTKKQFTCREKGYNLIDYIFGINPKWKSEKWHKSLAGGWSTIAIYHMTPKSFQCLYNCCNVTSHKSRDIEKEIHAEKCTQWGENMTKLGTGIGTSIIYLKNKCLNTAIYYDKKKPSLSMFMNQIW